MIMRKNTKKIFLTHGIYVLLVLIILGVQIKTAISNKNLEFQQQNSQAYIKLLQGVSGIGNLYSQHIHADFKFYIGGRDIDFNKEEFQAPEFTTLEFWKDAKVNKFTHLHPGQDNIGLIHVHATGITLSMFFRTIGVKLNDTCIVFSDSIGGTYCSSGGKRLRVFANGVKINAAAYEIKDLDKILIAYGNESASDIQSEMNSVGSRACIESNKC